MKIGLAQIEVIPGEIKSNFGKITSYIKNAKKQNCDIVAFPEMCVGGYLVGDRWTDKDFCDELMFYGEGIKHLAKWYNIAIIYGNLFFVENFPLPGTDGREARFNCAYVINANGKYANKIGYDSQYASGVHIKTNLPNYRYFDDERYFVGLHDFADMIGYDYQSLCKPFEVQLPDGSSRLIGVELCEDMWCQDYIKHGRRLNPAETLVKNGAECIINISASPWTFGKDNARHRRVKEVNCNRPFFYVNCIGAQNNGKNILAFDGESAIYNENGEIKVIAEEPFQETIITSEVKNSALNEKNNTNPLTKREPTSKIEEKYNTILEGLKRFQSMTGLSNDTPFFIGMSGGIDSSVVAVLLREAFGAVNVCGISMPSKHTSSNTQSNASELARKLGIRLYTIPIGTQVIDAIEHTLLSLTNATKIDPLVHQNIQAKIRATGILSNVAQMHGGVFTNNGNKTEIALGYATLYGDWGGAISPIGDLTKAEVYDLARYINAKFDKEIIPDNLIPDEKYFFDDTKVKPTAELEDEQEDPIKVGYHCGLIDLMLDYQKKPVSEIMRFWLEGILHEKTGITTELFKYYGLTDAYIFLKDLDWFCGLMQKSVFKRVQGVPNIVTSKTAFGYDLRESILPPTSFIGKSNEEYSLNYQEVIKQGTYPLDLP